MGKLTWAATRAAVGAITVCIAAAACSGKGQKPDFAAAEAAKEYYDSLNNGGHEYFTDMHLRTESIPDSYREQLVVNSKMFIHELRNAHNGISEVRVLNCKKNTSGNEAEAFLLLCFGDSSKEEIVVPMIKVNEKWMMK